MGDGPARTSSAVFAFFPAPECVVAFLASRHSHVGREGDAPGTPTMVNGQLDKVMHEVRQLLEAPGLEELTDRQLLDRFVRTRDGPPSPPWSIAMGRWFSACAGACSATATMPTTPFRQPGWCWPARRTASAGPTTSAAGCSRWRIDWR